MIRSFEAILGDLLIGHRGFLGDGATGRVQNDSRKVLPGDIFVAIPGTKLDGGDFIESALQAAAKVIIHEKPLDHYRRGVAYLMVTSARKAYARCCREFYERPDEVLRLFGVTGTNGKSTTAFLVEHLLRHGGVPCGLISTVEYRDGKLVRPASQTTPEAGVLFPLLAEMRRNGQKAVAMELSSHALAQDRISGARFRTGIFTNLSGDHLDYHRDMEHYYQAKKSFFTEYLDSGSTAVINVDDPWGARLAGELSGMRVITFGTVPGSMWRIGNVKLDAAGSRFRLSCPERAFDVAIGLIGMHNVYNLAGALLAVLDFGLSPAAIDEALSFPVRVPGRLESFRRADGAVFYVDYAHTDDALANVLTILRRICTGRLIAVFGAGGDRDRAKRPRMGKAAGEIADLLIVTSDNPRSEDPEAIISEIVAGVPEGRPFEMVTDRAAAIRRAAELAGPGDVVLVAGKGHENYQEIAGVRRSFDDRAVVKSLL